VTDKILNTSGGSVQGSLRDRIAAVLIEAAEFRGVYQLHNPDMKFLADAVIEALGIYEDEMGTGATRRTRIVSDWEQPDE
jgi:hypothetical protein